MMKKPEILKELYKKTLGEITSSKANWINYLKFSQNVYKHPFNKAALIYSQKPEATAVASMKIWNKQRRWVKTGTKAIPILSESTNPYSIEYLFDVSDTRGAKDTLPVKWKYNSSYESLITEKLRSIYGDNVKLESGIYNNIVYTISKTSQSLLNDRKKDIRKCLYNSKSNLRNYNIDDVINIYNNVVISSSLYMTLKKLDIDIDEQTKGTISKNLGYLKYFDNPQVISSLGEITFETSRDVLSIFEKTIKEVQKKELINKNINSVERREIYGNDIYRDRRDIVSEFRNGRDKEQPTSGEIRNDGDRLSKEGIPKQLFVLNGNRADNGGLSEGGRGSDRTNEEPPGEVDTTVSSSEEWELHRDGSISEEDREHIRRTSIEPSSIQIQGYRGLTDDKTNQLEQNVLKDRGDLTDNKVISPLFDDKNKKEVNTDANGVQINSDNRVEILDRESTVSFNNNELETDDKEEDTIYVGMEIDIEGRTFIVDKINDLSNYIRLKDAKFEREAGFPIFAEYTRSYLEPYIKKQEQVEQNKSSQLLNDSNITGGKSKNKLKSESIKATETIKPVKSGVANIISNEAGELLKDELKPESTEILEPTKFEYDKVGNEATKLQIDESQQNTIEVTKPINSDNNVEDKAEELQNNEIKQEVTGTSDDKSEDNKAKLSEKLSNFRITDDLQITKWNMKDRINQNIKAIQILKSIESEDRLATLDEKRELALYVGWGGLSYVFDERYNGLNKERQLLKSLLTVEEYKMARSTTTDAFYTPDFVIKNMYKALDKFGFHGGRILEPSMGIGKFFGILPENMINSELHGVEIDSISGRIARQLYPNANIQIKGFERTDFENNYFDIAITNVPFGKQKIYDKDLGNNKFSISPYFIAKSLEKVRPGGIVAVITGLGFMEERSNEVRKYFAERAELLGAIRLPNTTFKNSANTKTPTDILFFQKRENSIEIDNSCEWLNINNYYKTNEINRYYEEHSEMILGTMDRDSSDRYQGYYSVNPDETIPLEEQLSKAVDNLVSNVYYDIHRENSEVIETGEKNRIPIPKGLKEFCYAFIDDKLYRRENNTMVEQLNIKKDKLERIKGILEMKYQLKNVIDVQVARKSDTELFKEQSKLNKIYDMFVNKYGFLKSKNNVDAFKDDAESSLIFAIENKIDNKRFEKADIFFKRTINVPRIMENIETSHDALIASLNTLGKVNMSFMERLLDKPLEDIAKDLEGLIFQNPEKYTGDKYTGWETADEYLSGKVVQKLNLAMEVAKENPDLFSKNVEELKKVQPKKLEFNEIDVNLGATWIPSEYIKQFIEELLDMDSYTSTHNFDVVYSTHLNSWLLRANNVYRGGVKLTETYGTKEMDAINIIQATLNMKTVKIFNTYKKDNVEKRVLDKEQTILSREKQELIKQKFKEWIWKDETRREELVELYNQKFNNTIIRSYDGSHLVFPGMSTDVELKPYQKDAVAQVLYGGSTLLAHAVGAGKTYEMIVAGMERKRLGISHKNCYVVPNHLTEQWGNKFMEVYPSANILVATKNDLSPKNRKEFINKIAMGNYDAIIIGHSSFGKIPMSNESKREFIEKQIDSLTENIEMAKYEQSLRFTVKKLEAQRKRLIGKLIALVESGKKDDVLSFEQLGIDGLFVDEAHEFKNLFITTKMDNIAGLQTSESNKATDMFLKTQYINNITNYKGVVFGTATPITNTIAELYTMMRYLAMNELEERDLRTFDEWASTFGEVVTALELTPEGTGFRMRNRFAKFNNVPELMKQFRKFANIKLADDLKLPVPELETGKPITVQINASDYLKDYVKTLGERAEKVHSRIVEPEIDNMLKITNDGRKAALDIRLIDPDLPDFPDSKVNTAVAKAFQIWNDTKEDKLTQLMFCDLSTPKGKNSNNFSVYDDIKSKLINLGVPENEIAFIHDADTEAKKDELFAKFRKGEVRILLGSTQKLGTGANIQDRLVALHELDCPWRPSDVEQREGRIIRQGNLNEMVKILRYVTEGSFDAYSWQTLETKYKFVSQIMKNKLNARSVQDVDGTALSYAEIKAIATGNPKIKEKMEVEMELSRLQSLHTSFVKSKLEMERNVKLIYPKELSTLKENLNNMFSDLDTYKQNKSEDFNILLNKKQINDRSQAKEIIIGTSKSLEKLNKDNKDSKIYKLGKYQGFDLMLESPIMGDNKLIIKGKGKYEISLDVGSEQIMSKLDKKMENIESNITKTEKEINKISRNLEDSKIELAKEFPQQERLNTLNKRLNELNIELNLDKNEDTVIEEVEGKLIEENVISKEVEQEL